VEFIAIHRPSQNPDKGIGKGVAARGVMMKTLPSLGSKLVGHYNKG